MNSGRIKFAGTWPGGALALLLAVSPVSAAGTYQTPAAFVAEMLGTPAPAPQVLWLSGPLRAGATEILGHEPPALRTRYWERAGRTAWVLEEIGKEQPITVGLVVHAGRLETMRVLVFRESRGDEVRHGFFTRQFQGAGLAPPHRLDRPIDGISGATLSVHALTRLARLALYLDAHRDGNHATR